MVNENRSNHENISTKLSMLSEASLTHEEHNFYMKKYKILPEMKKNQLQISGLDLEKNSDNHIVVRSFIRSTIEKPIRLKESFIVLLNQHELPIAKLMVDFTYLGVLTSNTSTPWTFIFPEETILEHGVDELSDWSLAFETTHDHKLDLSDMKKSAISKFSQEKLEKINREVPLDYDELSFIGLSAQSKKSGDIKVSLLIRNGTMRDLELKHLPLMLFDAEGDLSVKGTFKLAHLMIQANTSKPVTLAFPKSSIIKEQMDLSKWSIQHVK